MRNLKLQEINSDSIGDRWQNSHSFLKKLYFIDYAITIVLKGLARNIQSHEKQGPTAKIALPNKDVI